MISMVHGFAPAAYANVVRALNAVGVDARSVPRTRDALSVFLAQRELTDVFTDLIEHDALAERLASAEKLEPPAVEALTPFLVSPHALFTATRRIHEFINGRLSDATRLSYRPCDYLVIRSPDGSAIHTVPVGDREFIVALSATRTLEQLLGENIRIRATIRCLSDLATAGYVRWLVP